MADESSTSSMLEGAIAASEGMLGNASKEPAAASLPDGLTEGLKNTEEYLKEILESISGNKGMMSTLERMSGKSPEDESSKSAAASLITQGKSKLEEAAGNTPAKNNVKPNDLTKFSMASVGGSLLVWQELVSLRKDLQKFFKSQGTSAPGKSFGGKADKNAVTFLGSAAESLTKLAKAVFLLGIMPKKISEGAMFTMNLVIGQYSRMAFDYANQGKNWKRFAENLEYLKKAAQTMVIAMGLFVLVIPLMILGLVGIALMGVTMIAFALLGKLCKKLTKDFLQFAKTCVIIGIGLAIFAVVLWFLGKFVYPVLPGAMVSLLGIVVFMAVAIGLGMLCNIPVVSAALGAFCTAMILLGIGFGLFAVSMLILGLAFKILSPKTAIQGIVTIGILMLGVAALSPLAVPAMQGAIALAIVGPCLAVATMGFIIAATNMSIIGLLPFKAIAMGIVNLLAILVAAIPLGFFATAFVPISPFAIEGAIALAIFSGFMLLAAGAIALIGLIPTGKVGKGILNMAIVAASCAAAAFGIALGTSFFVAGAVGAQALSSFSVSMLLATGVIALIGLFKTSAIKGGVKNMGMIALAGAAMVFPAIIVAAFSTTLIKFGLTMAVLGFALYFAMKAFSKIADIGGTAGVGQKIKTACHTMRVAVAAIFLGLIGSKTNPEHGIGLKDAISGPFILAALAIEATAALVALTPITACAWAVSSFMNSLGEFLVKTKNIKPADVILKLAPLSPIINAFGRAMAMMLEACKDADADAAEAIKACGEVIMRLPEMVEKLANAEIDVNNIRKAQRNMSTFMSEFIGVQPGMGTGARWGLGILTLGLSEIFNNMAVEAAYDKQLKEGRLTLSGFLFYLKKSMGATKEDADGMKAAVDTCAYVLGCCAGLVDHLAGFSGDVKSAGAKISELGTLVYFKGHWFSDDEKGPITALFSYLLYFSEDDPGALDTAKDNIVKTVQVMSELIKLVNAVDTLPGVSATVDAGERVMALASMISYKNAGVKGKLKSFWGGAENGGATYGPLLQIMKNFGNVSSNELSNAKSKAALLAQLSESMSKVANSITKVPYVDEWSLKKQLGHVANAIYAVFDFAWLLYNGSSHYITFNAFGDENRVGFGKGFENNVADREIASSMEETFKKAKIGAVRILNIVSALMPMFNILAKLPFALIKIAESNVVSMTRTLRGGLSITRILSQIGFAGFFMAKLSAGLFSDMCIALSPGLYAISMWQNTGVLFAIFQLKNAFTGMENFRKQSYDFERAIYNILDPFDDKHSVRAVINITNFFRAFNVQSVSNLNNAIAAIHSFSGMYTEIDRVAYSMERLARSFELISRSSSRLSSMGKVLDLVGLGSSNNKKNEDSGLDVDGANLIQEVHDKATEELLRIVKNWDSNGVPIRGETSEGVVIMPNGGGASGSGAGAAQATAKEKSIGDRLKDWFRYK